MIELRAREGTRGEAEDEAKEARGEADAQSDIFVMYVHEDAIDDKLSKHCKQKMQVSTQWARDTERKDDSAVGHSLSKHSHHQYSTCSI